ncbi:S1C family serine protease [Alicyclobacillus cycloheptanicus]|uniref:Serine protease Do n=1 Tax=Alicyclobacillus cycloheptanicus TaxID=1457 RepID=A0ABT9XIG7_9BACL|nr:trypsin-like peptidase domain-containing protein [Alicyclobacillus cycloheptanicus]MDQ0190105.1 serine protease Do [Alicyclobacillus cycloheptanicus]
MGFYNKGSIGEPGGARQRGNTSIWKWAGVVVLSALVGSGATLAAIPLLDRQGAVSTLASPSSTAPSGVTKNVSVNVNDQITNVVKSVEPDVVAVVNYTSVSNFFNQQSQLQESDIGSGVYFYKDGQSAYIVTNNHVVAGGSKVEVVLQSGKHVAATIVGTDPYTDLAVLKVPVSNFDNTQPAVFANSDDIQVGEPAIAIGNPMGLDFEDSVTSGIVSGDQRLMPVETPDGSTTLDYQPVIQTDAAINPGNSGGPLLNIDGQVIGINSSKIVEQGFEGMGFAIPSNEVQTIAAELIKTGTAVHPALGIEAYDLSELPESMWPNVPVNYGVYVEQVTSAQAKAAGLQQGDVIVAINGQTVQSSADLRTDLFKLQPGQKVQVTIYRGSTRKVLTVTVGKEDTSALNDSTTTPSSGEYGYGGGDEGGSDPFGSSPFSSGNPFGQ